MSTTDSNADQTEREQQFAGGPLREARLLVGNRDLEAAGIDELVAIWRDAGLRDYEVLSTSETGTAIHAVLDKSVDESRVSSLDSIKRWAYIPESREAYTYIFECTPQTFPPRFATDIEDVIGPYDLQLTEGGLLMSLAGPHGTIGDVLEEYEAAGLSPRLQKIGSYNRYSSPLDALTERQRTVLTVAFEMQYYEFPRKASVKDIAAEIGVESSTAAEHLQRAEAKLLAQLLGDHP